MNPIPFTRVSCPHIFKINVDKGSHFQSQICYLEKVIKSTKIRNRYIQVPHLTQNTTWESEKTQLNITNKSPEVSPFPAGDHKAAINRRKCMTNVKNSEFEQEIPQSQTADNPMAPQVNLKRSTTLERSWNDQ